MLSDFDEIDRKILKELQENARISNVDLADRVGLSAAPCLRRVRGLEEAGVIRKYVTLLDPAAVSMGVTVFVQISLDLQVENRLDVFERAILKRPEVLECYLMTVDADYLVRVVMPDVAAYDGPSGFPSRENRGNRVRMYSRALSGGSFTVPGPLRTKKSPSGIASTPFHFRNTGSGLRWQLTTHTVFPSTI